MCVCMCMCGCVCVCVCVGVSSLAKYKARYNSVLCTQTTDSAIHYVVHWLARQDCASMGQFCLLKSALPSIFDGSECINIEPIYNGLTDPVTEEWLQTYFTSLLWWQHVAGNA